VLRLLNDLPQAPGGSRPGNAVFVPPPPERLMDCLDPFEHFLHDEPEPMPSLIKAALAHV